ncbi:MAG: bifunctional DNA-formamidopyrimidine glycosylase/DNA-(apurinic or apyrimidinic site) lyase [Ardenticatenales bacterium]|nr:bifunctional DNA-formamidopyrimidine glycosylase/DNA-(apurinic or apyrimidinic site) lyase [Ardenticatenales bacterium]
MPELPEVESVVRDLHRAGLVGREIQELTVRWPRTLDRPSVEEARVRLRGARIADVRRRGKFIILDLSTGESLLVHLRMTGQIDLQLASREPDPHHHLLLALDHGEELRFRDTRKFGRFYLVAHPDEIVGDLGPEPIDPAFTLEQFRTMMRGRRGTIKPLLLNQSFVAGLGNIYVDEALFRAHIHPERRADTLTEQELVVLFGAMRDVLVEGIENRGTTLGEASTNYLSVAGRRGNNKQNLRVFRRTGHPCPDCGTPIERIIVGQRSSHVCPLCQPK